MQTHHFFQWIVNTANEMQTVKKKLEQSDEKTCFQAPD